MYDPASEQDARDARAEAWEQMEASVAEHTDKITLDRETLVRWVNALDSGRGSTVNDVRRIILGILYPRPEVE